MKPDFKTVEQKIANDDSLYYWAVDYCKEHCCTIRRFYADNREEIDKKISSAKAV